MDGVFYPCPEKRKKILKKKLQSNTVLKRKYNKLEYTWRKRKKKG